MTISVEGRKPLVNADPVTVVREFFARFGPTHDEMAAAAREFWHDDMYWASAGYDPPRITSLDKLVGDLEKAKDKKGIAGFRFIMVHIAADGEYVLTERFDDALDEHGEVLHSFKVMGILRVQDGRIRWARDYFYDTREFHEHYLPELFSSTEPKVLDGYLHDGD